jgi:hypothetical protein
MAMRLSRGSAIWMAFLPVCLGLSAGRAFAQASVEGAVRYDTETVAMSQVSARETRPEATENEAPQVVVLIADRPPPPDVAKSKDAYYAAAHEGRIRGLLLVFKSDPNDTRLNIFAKGGASDDTGVPDVFGNVTLTDLVRQGGWISGHLKTNQPRDFESDRGDGSAPKTPLVER